MLLKFNNTYPQRGKRVFIADSADLIGDVRLADDASVFYGAVLRGDINYISIGENTNIQDLSCCHVADEYPCIIGDNCVIGHNVTLHGCKIGNHVLIGMGAVILNGAEIGDGAIISAGSIITQNKVIPPRTMVRGVPAQVVRDITVNEYKDIVHYARKYVVIKDMYLAQNIGRS